MDIKIRAMPAIAADDAAISARGLTKRFGETIAVDNIDLQIRKGELFGLLGANGAGKSTIIKMLTTMLTPTSGEARVWGYDIVRERNEVRSSIGVVFQDPALDGIHRQGEPDFHGRMYGMNAPSEKPESLMSWAGRPEEKHKMQTTWWMKRRLEIARADASSLSG